MFTQTTNICSNCCTVDSIITDIPSGEIVCSACGFVIEDRTIDETYEERNFGAEAKLNQPEKQSRISTVVGPYDNTNENIKKSLKKLRERCFWLDLKKVIEEQAVDIFYKFNKEKSLKGLNREGIIAAVIYISCKKNRNPRSISDIATPLHLNEADVRKYVNLIQGIVPCQSQPIAERVNSIITKDIHNYNDITDVEKCSQKISQRICEKGILEGRKPKTIAGCAYLISSIICGASNSLKDIATKYETTPFTLKKVYNKLMEYKDDILPEELKSHSDKLVNYP